jgi:acetoacetate decarboxylase
MTALREVWGFPCKLGDVSLVTAEDGVSATVSRAGVTLVEASLDVPEPIDPASVRFDPELNIRCAPGLETGRRHDLLQLVQIDPEIQVRQAVRGHGRLTFTTPSEADPWHHLPVRNMVAAVHCLIDTEMPLARFVMPY